MKHLPFTLFLLAPLLSGCDPVRGVQTSLTLKVPYNAICLDQAIRHTEGVGQVEVLQPSGDSLKIASHLEPMTDTSTYWAYSWNYDQTKLGGGLEIIKTSEGYDADNHFWRMGFLFPEEQANAFIPIMQRIDKNIETSCGISLSSKGSFTRF
jgi:hypothetical protein